VYSQEGIQQYWSDKSGELLTRWTQFLGLSTPFILKLFTNTVTGQLEMNEKDLTKDFRVILEKLGPTYVKMGQMLSIRPDIIGDTAMFELKKL
jgi:aarF domain-containing kinase